MKVAIIGAGVGGLTLAAALRRKAPDAEVALYERDESAFARPQGYAIGLKPDGGLRALGEIGLREAAMGGETVRIGGFVFTDQQGRELLRLEAGNNEGRATYRIQRRHLKEVLLSAVEGTPIHFGHTCVGYDGATVRLADGTTAEADVVVGADGVGSAIRRQLIGDDRHYLGLTAIYGDAPLLPDHPLLAGGYFMSLGRDGSSFFCYTQPGGSTHFSYTVHAANEAEVADATQEALLDRVRRDTAGWHELVGQILAKATADTIGVRGYYDREPAASVRSGPVWLIGDAAHPMSPFQGQGANTAMLDAVEVGGVLGGGTGDADAVAAGIAKRGRKAALESRNAAAQFHTTRRFRQRNRDLGFRLANRFIKLFSRG